MTLFREGYNRLDREELERLRAQETVKDARIKALEAEVKTAERRGEQTAFELAAKIATPGVDAFATYRRGRLDAAFLIRQLAKEQAR